MFRRKKDQTKMPPGFAEAWRAEMVEQEHQQQLRPLVQWSMRHPLPPPTGERAQIKDFSRLCGKEST